MVKQDVSHFTSIKNEKYIQTVFVAIALRIAITSENISFYSTGVKSVAFCIIDMRIFKFLFMWRGPISSPFPGTLSRTGPALSPVLD